MTAKGFATGPISVMVKRIALFRIVSFCLCAACAAFGQNHRAATFSKALPDAPSARFLTQTNPLQGMSAGNNLRFPVAFNAAGAPSAARFLPATDQRPGQPTSSILFFNHIYPSLISPNLRYRPSDNQSLMGRATDAASWILLTRDPSGKRSFNTTYFLRLATSIIADSGSRRFRTRSKTAPLSDFGSTLGNDAGMNFLHEFGPSLQQVVTSHLPKFVSHIQERLRH
jgi:hypothetical protein